MSKPPEFFENFARDAYHAYLVEQQFDFPIGDRIHAWEKAPPLVKRGWLAAVKTLFRELYIRDTDTGELIVGWGEREG